MYKYTLSLRKKKRRLKRLNIILFLAVVLLPFCSRDEKTTNEIVIRGFTMGTLYSVKIAKPLLLKDRIQQLRPGIERILNRVNKQMSVFLNDSEISKFNARQTEDWFPVSRGTANVIKQSLLISAASNGALDITVGPLIDLWGFGPAKGGRSIPDPRKIKAALTKTGYKRIAVSLTPPQIKKSRPSLRCNLSALAKGYAVDEVAAYLEGQGLANHMVEIGGEVRVRGYNQRGTPWRIGIAAPAKDPGIQRVVELKNMSMATSGDYQNYFEVEGKRYSHTIDPRTGRPVSHNLASVTVLHQSCMAADAWATAINVLGAEDGLHIASENHLPVFLIVRSGDHFEEKMTTWFKGFIH